MEKQTMKLNELKAEAVKRYKEAEKQEINANNLSLRNYWRGRKEEVEEMFDLTEEDLKQQLTNSEGKEQ